MKAEMQPLIKSLRELAVAEQDCTRCPLYRDATQAVPGEGPSHAALMLVGEQPGDKEDLAGKPFVGPSGRVLDQALKDAGIDRDQAFVTGAVKHFKHEMRGKRRLHKRPNNYEIERCKLWLDFERRLVKPLVIVALGVTAARGVLIGRTVTIAKVRGKPMELTNGANLIVTVHPSSLLRIKDEGERHKAYRLFVADLKAAAACSWAVRSKQVRRRRPPRCGSRHPGLRERRPDLLHAVDQIRRSRRRQHQTAGRITAARNRHIGLDLIDARHGEFDPQRLAVKDKTADRVSKGLRNIGAIDVPNGRGLPLPCGCRRARRRSWSGLFVCHQFPLGRFL